MHARSLRLFLITSLMLEGCGASDEAPPAPVAKAATAGENATGKRGDEAKSANDPLSEGPEVLPRPNQGNDPSFSLWLDSLRSWAPLCQGYPSKENCDDGDATLFSGLLCLAGEPLGCAAVQAAQDKAGKFWRSPRRVGTESSNSFSRDMALGVLAYLVASKDRTAATAWLQWIDQNSVCQLGSGSSCQLRTWRYCRDDTDGRCLITPAMWTMMSRVWQYLELPQHKAMNLKAEDSLIGDAGRAAVGYQLHLKAVITFLYEMMDQKLPLGRELAQRIAERQPENLFFRYLQGGPSQALRQDLQQHCPGEKPELAKQWAWERDTAEHAALDSMGWDCIFLGELLLKKP